MDAICDRIVEHPSRTANIVIGSRASPRFPSFSTALCTSEFRQRAAVWTANSGFAFVREGAKFHSVWRHGFRTAGRNAKKPRRRRKKAEGFEPRVGGRAGDGEHPPSGVKRRRRSRTAIVLRRPTRQRHGWTRRAARRRRAPHGIRAQRRQPEEGKRAEGPGNTGTRPAISARKKASKSTRSSVAAGESR